jgi:hypothetical protein
MWFGHGAPLSEEVDIIIKLLSSPMSGFCKVRHFICSTPSILSCLLFYFSTILDAARGYSPFSKSINTRLFGPSIH